MKRDKVAKGCFLITNSSQIYHRIITKQEPFVESVGFEATASTFVNETTNRYLCAMRRLLAMALVLWYGLFAIGLHIHVHYCCGQIANIAINTTADACSSQCASAHHAAAEATCSSSCASHQHPAPESNAKTCCTSHVASEATENTSCSVDRSCCSSDDIHLSIDEAHAKSSLDFELPAVFEADAPFLFTCVTSLAQAATHHPAPREGIPLYLLYQQPLLYL